MRLVRRGLDHVYLGCVWLSGLLLIGLCLLVLWSILARLIGVYAGGATDVAGYVMATSTFTALAYAFRTDGHIRVALLIQRAMGARRRKLETVCLGIMAAITAFLALYMGRLCYDSWDFGERSEGADAILLWIPQLPVAVGSAVFAVAVFHTFLEALFDYDAVNPERVVAGGPNEV